MMKQFLLPLFLLSLASTPLQAEKAFSDSPEAMQASVSLPQLRVEGNKILNPAGEAVILRGIALSDPEHLESVGMWAKEYFEAVRSWNANLVRIPVHPARWRKLGYEGYMDLLDLGVQWAGELGMYVIIDWHTIGNPITGIPHNPSYLTTQEETMYFWHQIAHRYKGNPTVAFFELWNEATNFNGQFGRMPWLKYKAFMEEIIYMLYAIDPTVIPVVGGFNWGYDLRNVREHPIEAEGVAYATHPYPQKERPFSEEKWEDAWGFVADDYPLLATEFGFMSEDMRGAHVPCIGDETYGVALTDYFNKKGISWTAWVFDPRWTPNLITGWDYNPTPSGAFFKSILERDNP